LPTLQRGSTFSGIGVGDMLSMWIKSVSVNVASKTVPYSLDHFTTVAANGRRLLPPYLGTSLGGNNLMPSPRALAALGLLPLRLVVFALVKHVNHDWLHAFLRASIK
jgi:hypothetical protein